MDDSEKIKNNNVVKTYADDLADIAGNNKGDLIKTIIHQEEEHQIEKINSSPQIVEVRKNKFFMLLGALFVVLSLITLYFFFFRQDANTIRVEKQFIPIIFNDQYNYQEISGLSKDEIAQTVLNQVNATKVKDGGLEGIYLTENKRIIGLRRFVSLIKSSFVPGDSLFFINDNFLIGVVKKQIDSISSSRYGFFIIIKMRSIGDIFENMRAWENKIMTDLHGFLGVEVSSETNYLFQKSFEDGIIENKNARILYDKDGKLILTYVFADDDSVIITNAQSAVREIILRLASSKAKQ